MSAHDVDVTVVGGGPVGVTTALLLAQRGFSVRVFERAPEVYDLPRAIVMDDEIQRVFHDAGLGPELDAITTPLLGAEFVRPDGERIIGVELPLDAPWPLGLHPSVMYYQPELEAFLRAAAAAQRRRPRAGCGGELGRAGRRRRDGADRHRPRPESMARRCGRRGQSDPQAAGARLRRPGLRPGLAGARRPAAWTRAELPRFVQQVCDPERPTTYVVGHGEYRRWEFQLQPGETREEMVEPSRVWELLEPWLTADDAELIRAVVYRFHATVADSMRSGRIFLAGDAAHQMPPFLGQGLCSGIRDAANLAWKLRLVDDGLADDALLDTYGEERLPHAAGVVAHAVDTGRLIDELSGREPATTGLDAAYGGSRPFPILQHGMLYGDHPAVGRQLPQPTVDGHRLDELLGRDFAIVVDDRAVLAEAGPSGPVSPRWSRCRPASSR